MNAISDVHGPRGRHVIGLILALLIGGRAAGQDLAFVRSLPSPGSTNGGAQGNAWLFHRGGQCYAATPKHVLINALEARDDQYAEIAVIRSGRAVIHAQADRCAVFRNRDLAIMHVTGVAEMADCGRVLTGIPNIDTLLGTTAGASLLTASDSGRFERSTLEIRAATAGDSDHFWVAPVAARDRLTEGMSGGLVLIQDELAGFLLAVATASDGPAAGMAKVFRADRASVLLTRALEGSVMGSEVEGSCATAAMPRASSGVSAASSNRAAAGCGAAVTAWSAPPVAPAQRPDNLVGARDVEGHWRAVAAGEVTVDVRLCPSRQSSLSGVTLDTTGCLSGDNRGVDVEVLVRPQSTDHFVSLGFGPVPEVGHADINTNPPLFAGEVRLRFVPRGSAPRTVCVGPLIIH